MSAVLDYFRSKDRRFGQVADEELTAYIAERHPEFLADPEFSAAAKPKAPARFVAQEQAEQEQPPAPRSLDPQFVGTPRTPSRSQLMAAAPEPQPAPAPSPVTDQPGIGDDVRGVGRAFLRGVERAKQAVNVVGASNLAVAQADLTKAVADLQEYETKFGTKPDTTGAIKRKRNELKGRIAELEGEVEQRRKMLPDQIAAIGASQQRIDALPPSAALEEFGSGDWLKAFARNPVEITASIMAESLPLAAPGMALGAVASGPAGMALGVGAGSFSTEYATALMTSFERAGVDIRQPDWPQRVTQEQLEQAVRYGAQRGVPIALLDAASGGLAGRWLGPALGKGAGAVTRGVATETGVQMAAGAAGETAAQAVAGDEFSPRDIFAEAVAEVPGGVAEVASNVLTQRQPAEAAIAPAQPPGAPPAPPAPAPAPAPEPTPTPAPTTASPQPEGPQGPPGAVLGRMTEVRAANEVKVPSRYAWLPADQINASHLAPSFVPNPAYAPIVNTRRYDTDAAEQTKVVAGAAAWDPMAYATNTRSAAEGPVMVSRGSDGVLRVLGGNGRWQMIQRLNDVQRAEFGRAQDDEAAAFGLAPRPSPDHVLVRLLPDTDVATPEGVENARKLVDLLNPSPGLIETTAAMARNDARKVDPLAIQLFATGEPTPAESRDWLATQIATGTLDRNTRTQVAGSDSQVVDYVHRVVLHLAYRGDDDVVDAVRNPKTPAATRSMLTSPVPTLLALRMQGDTKLAEALTEMVHRVTEQQAQGLGLDGALATVHAQEEAFATPELQLARNLAGALSQLVVRHAPNAKGVAKIDFDDTAAAFEDFFARLGKSIRFVDSTPDLLGQTRTVLEAATDFVRSHIGTLQVVKEGGQQYTADPRVTRLNQLLKFSRDRALTQTEHAEQRTLEADLGQAFMTFWTEEQSRQEDAAKQAELQQMEIKSRQGKRLLGGDIRTQGDMFAGDAASGPTGQLSLFERRRKFVVDARQQAFNFEAPTVAAQPPVSTVPAPRPAWTVSSQDVPGQARTVVSRVDTQLITTGRVDIVGKDARNLREVAELLQVFRSPQFEIFHWIPVKDGKVIGRFSFTARIPDTTFSWTNDLKTYPQIHQKLKDLGADGYYIAHNHPSGDPDPSNPDRYATRQIAEAVPGFRGHIVINHNKYATIDSKGRAQVVTIDPQSTTPDPLHAPIPPEFAQIIGAEIDSTPRLVRLQQYLRDRTPMETVQILLLNARLRTVALLEVGVEFIRSDKRFPEWLRTTAQANGAVSAIAAVHAKAHAADPALYRTAIEAGYFLDVMTWSDDPAEIGVSLRAFNPYISPGPRLLASRTRRDRVERLNEPRTPYEVVMPDPPHKGGKLPTVPVTLGQWDKIRPVEMPELVKLAKALTSELPRLKRLPVARGMFKGGPNSAEVILNPLVFADPIQAAKTLAHEIGHLIDFLPERTLARGNLFGRIASLRGWLATTFPQDSTVPMKNVLTPKDRRRIRAEAERAVGPRPPKDEEADLAAWQAEVSREYAERIEQEIEARKLVKLEEARAEAWELSKLWRPLPEEPSESYLLYRKSGREIYADVLSAMLNSPGFVEEEAPIFYRMFWDFLSRKPEVQANLFALQDFLQKGKVSTLEARRDDIHTMFSRGEDRMRVAAEARELRARSWKGFWASLGNELVDRFWTIRKKAQQSGREDVRELMDALGMREQVNMQWIRRLYETVIQPAENYGFTLDDLGEVLMMKRIMAGDRQRMANPAGHTPLTARAQLREWRRQHGLGAWTVMEDLLTKFHALVYGVTQEAVAVGAYNQQTFRTIIAPNKDHYAAFAVVDYLEDFVPAGIRQQIGTLKDIANPLVATVYKTIALNNLIVWQRAKRTTRDMLQQHFAAEILPAEMVGPHDAKRPKAHPDWGILELLEDGKPQHWYVDPFVAEAFAELTPGTLHRVTRFLDEGFRRFLYPLLITYNPGFMFITSPIREVRRTGRNLPIMFGRVRLLREYARVARDVVARYRGTPTGLTREMEANLAIATPFDTVGHLHRDDALGRLLQRFQLAHKPEKPSVWQASVFKPVRWLGDRILFWGQVVDSLPKYGAYRILRRDVRMSPKEAAAWVRSYAGLPGIHNRGRAYKTTKALVPFWNVFVQGWRADLRLMTKPKTRSGYWFRWAASEGWVTALQAAAAAGLLGAALKELMDGISEYRKTNALVVPIGEAPSKEFGRKTVFLTLPRDETDRVLSGLMYRIITAAAGGKPDTTAGEDLAAMLDFGGGQVPGMNPLLTIGHRWAQYAMDRPPLDPNSGRPIVPARNWNAGGIDSLVPMVNWTLGQARLNLWATTDEPTSTLEAVFEGVPAVGRFVQITDYGYRERQEAQQAKADRLDAKRRLSYGDEVMSLVTEFNHLRGIPASLRTPSQTERMTQLGPFYHTIYRPIDEQVEAALAEGQPHASAVATLQQAAREFTAAQQP